MDEIRQRVDADSVAERHYRFARSATARRGTDHASFATASRLRQAGFDGVL
jgi:hypothetical protein